MAAAIKKATFLQLAFMIYGAVCAGAFGVENMIPAAGPGMALLTLVLMPFLFSLPASFAVSELTTMLPLEGGQYRWSRLAFGDFWGFQAGWWAWMTGIVTNGLFAVLFANYLQTWFPGMTGLHHWLVCLTLIWCMHLLNLRGIRVVGNTAIVLSAVLLLPFVLLLVFGVMQWQHNPFTPLVAPGKSLAGGFSSSVVLAIWLYSGYDKLSAAAEEVEHPQRTFPPALLLAAIMAMLSYVLPTMAALAALGNWQEWSDAYFTTAAARIGGNWLGHSMTASALCSNALLLNVTMLATSRYPLTLAQDGFLPAFLTQIHPRFGTPTQALLWGSLTYSLLTLFDFTQLIIIYAWFQIASYILLYANVWKMRHTHAGAPRPFKIPLGKPALVLLMLPTWVMALLAINSTVFENGLFQPRQLLIGVLALFSGPLVFVMVKWLRAGEIKLPEPAAKNPTAQSHSARMEADDSAF